MKQLILSFLFVGLLAGTQAQGQVATAEEIPVKSRISLYPNPVAKFLSLEVKNYLYERLEVNIKDLTGQIVFTQRLDRLPLARQVHEMDLSKLPDGIYLVNIHDRENKEHVIKRIVKR